MKILFAYLKLLYLIFIKKSFKFNKPLYPIIPDNEFPPILYPSLPENPDTTPKAQPPATFNEKENLLLKILEDYSVQLAVNYTLPSAFYPLYNIITLTSPPHNKNTLIHETAHALEHNVQELHLEKIYQKYENYLKKILKKQLKTNQISQALIEYSGYERNIKEIVAETLTIFLSIETKNKINPDSFQYITTYFLPLKPTLAFFTYTYFSLFFALKKYLKRKQKK